MALDDGTFVWADSTDADFTSTGVDQFLVRASGGVGIGVNDPSEALDVNGTARLRAMPTLGAGTTVIVDANGKLWKLGSSRRYKTSIRDLNGDPQSVLRLEPVRFEWKSTGQEDIGLIAEDVEKIVKDLVVYDEQGRPDAVKYDRMALYLLAVVKDQQERIAALERAMADRDAEGGAR